MENHNRNCHIKEFEKSYGRKIYLAFFRSIFTKEIFFFFSLVILISISMSTSIS